MAAAVAHPTVISSHPGNAAIDWPEPIQRVQLLADSGLSAVPSRYIQPESERPSSCEQHIEELKIPLIDLSGLEDEKERKLILAQIAHACEEWGFFQIVNHGIPIPLLQRISLVIRQFFHLPLEEKQAYANNPTTYEGYGSRMGIEKGTILDWQDYFYLNVLPTCRRDTTKWPTKPTLWRETVDEYGQQVANLSQKLLAAISSTLQLPPSALREAFGNEQSELSLRVNFYSPCPQPDMTLGLSAHSDPGGLTVLLQDEHVGGLQVRHDGRWVTVEPLLGGLIVNVGDQIQLMSNGIYKSVEHRAIVNRNMERLTIAAFWNPSTERAVSGPLKELVTEETPARYRSLSYKEYRTLVRRIGLSGKNIVESISSSR